MNELPSNLNKSICFTLQQIKNNLMFKKQIFKCLKPAHEFFLLKQSTQWEKLHSVPAGNKKVTLTKERGRGGVKAEVGARSHFISEM